LCALALLVGALVAAALAACGTPSSQGAGTPPGGTGSDGGVLSPSQPSQPSLTLEDAGASSTLAITPATASIIITNPSAPPTQSFTAAVTTGGTTSTVAAIWSLADFTVASIDANGTVTPNGAIAGTVTVQASYGGLMATATLNVAVSFQTNLGDTTLPDGTPVAQDAGGITPGNLGALSTVPDGGSPSPIIYPYDGTVFPRGLLAPIVQFGPGSATPQDFKISLDTTAFHWDGFGHVGNPAALVAAMPQNVWSGALQSAQVDPTTNKAVVTLSLVTAASSIAYGPSHSKLVVAQGQLTGIIYYESYGSDAVSEDAGSNGGTDFGLWAVKPGTSAPPKNLQSGCVICHGVSAAGNTLTDGTDDPTLGSSTGVFRIETDGGYTQLGTAPANFPYAIGGSIDSRGLGWGVVSPDGKVVLRGEDQFWGGLTLDAFLVPSDPLLDDAGAIAPLSTNMTVNGGFNMFVPSFSVDGQHLVYINAADDAGAPSQSVGIVDTTIAIGAGGASGFGSVTLTQPRTIYDSTTADGGLVGTYTKVPTFLPDSQTVVLEETVADYSGYNNMLPDYGGVDGRLSALQPSDAGAAYAHTVLTNANAGYDPAAPTENYEPKALPVEVGGYYWVVFASKRADAYPLNPTPKKLWVTAISVGTPPGVDPSNPPFTLTNQSIVPLQPSQRGYWALAPCQGNGAGCATNDDCCGGSCRPPAGGPPTALVCQPPPTGACAQIGDTCRAGHPEDCCNAASGVQCIGTLNGYGKCEIPANPPQ
jgi:hypothetical protein